MEGKQAPSQRFALRLEGVGKRFGPVKAVDAIDLDVPAGEIVALLGPSGCGKTSTLRLIAGLEKPDEGRIFIADREVAGPAHFVPPEARRIGLVFQHYALFPHLSVAENIGFGLSQNIKTEADKAKAKARVQDMLGLVGLAALGKRMPHELSGGQQQRVALARAMAPEPEILLLDEPFSNLDARMRHSVRDEVRQIIKRSGITAVFVTHDQEEALIIGDRVAVLNGGRLEQVDTPERLFHQPASLFVADFMGLARFLPAKVDAESRPVTEIGSLDQVLDLPAGSEIEVLARPDDVEIWPLPDQASLELEGSKDLHKAQLPATHPGQSHPTGHVACAPAFAEGRAKVVRVIFQGIHKRYRIELDSGRQLESLQPHTCAIAEGATVQVGLSRAHALACFRHGRAVS